MVRLTPTGTVSEMVKQCAWLSAYVAGTGHELTDWTSNESEMDLNNNAVGRDCGDSSDCDVCCRRRLASGRLTILTAGGAGTGYYQQGYTGISDTARPNAPQRY